MAHGPNYEGHVILKVYAPWAQEPGLTRAPDDVSGHAALDPAPEPGYRRSPKAQLGRVVSALTVIGTPTTLLVALCIPTLSSPSWTFSSRGPNL